MAKKTTASEPAQDAEPDTPEQPVVAEAEAAPATGEQPEPPAGDDGGDQDESSEQLPPGVYEYAFGIGCVYPHVPLTCHAFHPAVEATETTPAIQEQEATRFEWPEGPPDDGRWVKTRKKANQAADNAGGLLSGKE
ncbi:hypothetical protein [Streptomyces sp. NBC_00198]|uniref:hypothetical protein n=1 Tax=Streptomyces sp. NBC_00198 TaxID=2975677 RepID=UPI002255CF9F|nr:hypothetical protein [Streptomyces sp. NBC_00198]MCX5285692.1 hypothetical protein [Streptomyces sp. NBC_00198]MCX5286206.1 hypothetical protein [Streptomyces sp. NBC_00198]